MIICDHLFYAQTNWILFHSICIRIVRMIESIRDQPRDQPETIDLITDDEEEKEATIISDVESVVQQVHVEQPGYGIAGSSNAMVNHKCNFCDYVAKSKSILTVHIRTHTGERPHECEICGKRFSRKGTLRRHMKTHRDSLQFQCSVCYRGFADGMKWKAHQNRCKVKGVECYLCKKVVCRMQTLVEHMRKHTGEMLRCSICPKQFGSKYRLNYHMETHVRPVVRRECARQNVSK